MLPGDHPGSSVHQGDIGAVEDCERVISEVLNQHGRLDILVNNAGITLDKTVRRMTPHDWDHVVQVNLSGAFYLSRAILQHMLDRGSGRIINISSIIGESGNIGQANYAAAKAGLFGLTMSLAQETARKGITVNSVAPGYVSTEMVAAVPQAALEKVIAKIPAGRLGEPDEIARVVEFLADPDSGFITGQIYSVNGGQSGVAVEQARHRAVLEHLVDGLGQQRRDRQHRHLREALLVRDRQRVGEDHLTGAARGQLLATRSRRGCRAWRRRPRPTRRRAAGSRRSSPPSRRCRSCRR